MDIYIVDANLIFSGILNLKSGIAQFILDAEQYDVQLYAPELLKTEIESHQKDIIKASGLSLPKIRYARDKLYASIEFIDDQIIPFEEYILAMRIVRDIDPDDVTFVALNNYMNETLWTGDNELYRGLKAKGYTRVVNFKDLKKLYNLD